MAFGDLNKVKSDSEASSIKAGSESPKTVDAKKPRAEHFKKLSQ